MGRRKSWIIPLQYLISAFMLLTAFIVTDLLDYGHVPALAVIFFILNLLAASQDVAGGSKNLNFKENKSDCFYF